MLKQFVQRIYLFIISFISVMSLVKGQSCVLPVALEDRMAKAEYIVEGEISSQISSWNTDFKSIYTIHKIAVHTQIKGKGRVLDSLLLVTRGGLVGNILQVDHPELVLKPGQKGLFFLSEINLQLMEALKADLLFKTDFSLLGFVQYDKYHKSASDALDKYEDITTDLYAIFEREGYEVDNGYALNRKEAPLEHRAISVSSFTPTSLIAGASDQITIYGSGFGSSQGNGFVGFSNADDGGGSYVLPLNSQYISWSDTQITLEVPSRAGTGTVLVQNDAGESNISATSLYIDYNLSNVGYSGDAYRPNLVDADGSGGLELVLNVDLNNDTDAKNAFIRGLNSWRCSNNGGTGIYLELGSSTTTAASVNDEENVIYFSDALGENTLGVTTSWYSGCSSGGGPWMWYLEEVDIVFADSPGNPGFFWNFDAADNSTAANEYDFESVALHELGHLHQLGHVNNFSNIMYFSIGNGVEKRYLEQSDLDGGDDVLSFSQGVCGQSDMTSNYICSILPLESLSLDAFWSGTDRIDIQFEVEASDELQSIDIRKSTDGTHFHSIREYAKPDPLKKAFQFTDFQPFELNYYQIRVTDEDGLETLSDVVLVRSEQGDDKPYFYPNPVSRVLNLSLMGQEHIEQFRIKDMNGRVLRNMLAPLPGWIDVQDLPAGPYILEYRSRQSVNAIKLLKN